MRNIIFYTLAALFLGACATPKPPIISDVKTASFPSNLKEGIELQVRLKNPNTYAMVIRKMDFDVDVNGSPIGRIRNEKRIKIKRKSEEYHKIFIEGNFTNALTLGQTLLSIGKSGKIDLHIKGDVKGRVFLIRRKLNVNENVQMSIPNIFGK
jgi:LEA14-like dessication related protein